MTFGRRLQQASPKSTLARTIVSVSNVTATTATLTWTPVSGATGYLVGRDGTDSNGNGPWSTALSAGVTSQTFTSLNASTTYTLYCTPQPGGAQQTIQVTTAAATVAGAAWSDTNPPWVLQSSESVMDNFPTGINVVDYDSFSGASRTDLGAGLAAIRAAQTQPYVVKLGAGSYHIANFSFGIYTTGVGRGYQDVNSTKLWCGLVGNGATSPSDPNQTYVDVDPNIMIQAQLDAIAAGSPSPVQVSAFFIGDQPQPSFFSGITFRGNFQQTVTLNGGGNITSSNKSGPAIYEGLKFSAAAAGSTVQYCRFQGFGYDASAFPPYETGQFSSSHGLWTVRRTELDGRLAAAFNSSQPVSAGGLMTNFEGGEVQVLDSWLHHTRRSGFAMHDHGPGESPSTNSGEVDSFYTENFQVENIAITSDSFAGGHLGFACSNVEALKHTFTYNRPRFTAGNYGTVTDGNNGQVHIVLATPNGDDIMDGIVVTDPICSGTPFADLLVIRIIQTPNSYGTSPLYTLYTTQGLGALPITVTNQGKTLTPILSSNYNSAVHNSANNYIIVGQ